MTQAGTWSLIPRPASIATTRQRWHSACRTLPCYKASPRSPLLMPMSLRPRASDAGAQPAAGGPTIRTARLPAKKCARWFVPSATSNITERHRQAPHVPLAPGIQVEQIEAYYDQAQHTDWLHAAITAQVLKAQHPEFKMWNQGVHARSGVAGADCQMPYLREGAMKVTDHHVRSPMLNTRRACLPYYPVDESEMTAHVELIQRRTRKHYWTVRSRRGRADRRSRRGLETSHATGLDRGNSLVAASRAMAVRLRERRELDGVPRGRKPREFLRTRLIWPAKAR